MAQVENLDAARTRAQHARGHMVTLQGKRIASQFQMIIGALVSLERTTRGTLEGAEIQNCTDFIRDRLQTASNELQDLELSL